MPHSQDKTDNSHVLEVITRRYSCRRYSPAPVEKTHIDAMAEAVRQAPSACNRQPYTFVFISDRALIKEIARAVPLGPASVNKWMETAPLIVAAVGRPELVWHRLTQVIDTDYHRTDAVIAMDHLSLVATEMGLGTCWVGWFHRKKIERILGVRNREEVVILMTVGYPDGEPSERKPRKEMEDLVVRR